MCPRDQLQFTESSQEVVRPVLATGQVFATEGAGVNSKSTCITIFGNHGTASGQFGELSVVLPLEYEM